MAKKKQPEPVEREIVRHEQPPRYVETLEDGREQIVYRASGLMLCPTVFAALALGHTQQPPPDWMLAKFEEGHQIEPKAIRELMRDVPKYDKLGAQYVFTQKLPHATPASPQEAVELRVKKALGKGKLAIPGVIIRGHIDDCLFVSRVGGGVLGSEIPELFADEPAVIEVKGFGPSYMEKFRRHGVRGFTGYAWQLSVYQHATGLPAAFIVWNKQAEDANDRIHVEWVPEPIVPLKDIRAFIEVLEETVALAMENEELPACGKSSFPCPMWHLHDVIPEKDVEFDVEVDDIRVDELVGMWLKAKDEEATIGKTYKAAEAARKEIAEALRKALAERGVQATAEGVRVKTAIGVISWKVEQVGERVTKAHERVTFDVKELKRED